MSARPGRGSDNHLQLPGILDDLFGQLGGGDGGVFWLLVLAGKAVVVVRSQDPTSLLGIVCHLFGRAEEENPGSLSKKDFLIGLLNASCDFIPDSIQQDVNEESIALSGDVPLGQEHLVVAALHQVLLEGHRVLDVDIGLDVLGRQAF